MNLCEGWGTPYPRGGYFYPKGIAKGAMPANSAIFRSIREELEKLPKGEWTLGCTVLLSDRKQIWNWVFPADAYLQRRADLILTRAANARNYANKDGWLDEVLRLAESARFPFVSSGSFSTLPPPTVINLRDGSRLTCRSWLLPNVIRHSISLCDDLEREAVGNEALTRVAALAAHGFDMACASTASNKNRVEGVLKDLSALDPDHRKFTKTHFWQLAGYGDSSCFLAWQRGKPASEASEKAFEGLMRMDVQELLVRMQGIAEQDKKNASR